MDDLRSQVSADLRLHPRVAQQNMYTEAATVQALADGLLPMPCFRESYHGAICVLDWDHRLPSKRLVLRIFAYYSEESLKTGERAYDARLGAIAESNLFPEFDVIDFDFLISDEAYEMSVSLDGNIERTRFVSAWRRNIEVEDGAHALSIVHASEEFAGIKDASRSEHLGELEAVSWTPPCESEHDEWTLDVWYLQAFDGRIGTGRSFLVDLKNEKVIAMRDFSVRTG